MKYLGENPVVDHCPQCGAERRYRSRDAGRLAGKLCKPCNLRKIARERETHRGPRQDLSGQKFGRWTVLEYAGARGVVQLWRCRCECGTERVVRHSTLIGRGSPSCGCSRNKPRTHGLSSTRAYGAWTSMMARCYEPSHVAYPAYGGRGIIVTPEWHDVTRFYEDMGEPEIGQTLERLDVNGDYCPENVEWATAHEQSRNKRNNVVIEWNGKRQCLMDWAIETGLSFNCLWHRLKAGWTVERALATPSKR